MFTPPPASLNSQPRTSVFSVQLLSRRASVEVHLPKLPLPPMEAHLPRCSPPDTVPGCSSPHDPLPAESESCLPSYTACLRCLLPFFVGPRLTLHTARKNEVTSNRSNRWLARRQRSSCRFLPRLSGWQCHAVPSVCRPTAAQQRSRPSFPEPVKRACHQLWPGGSMSQTECCEVDWRA